MLYILFCHLLSLIWKIIPNFTNLKIKIYGSAEVGADVAPNETYDG